MASFGEFFNSLGFGGSSQDEVSAEVAGGGPMGSGPGPGPAPGSFNNPYGSGLMPGEWGPMNPGASSGWGGALRGVSNALQSQDQPYWSHPITSPFTAPVPGQAYRQQQQLDNQRRGQDMTASEAARRSDLGQDRLDFDIQAAQQKAALSQQSLQQVRDAYGSPETALAGARARTQARDPMTGQAAPGSPTPSVQSPAMKDYQGRLNAHNAARARADEYARRTGDVDTGNKMVARAPHPGKPPEQFNAPGPIPGSGGAFGQLNPASGKYSAFSRPPMTNINLPGQGKIFTDDQGAKHLVSYGPEGEMRKTELSPPTPSAAQAKAAGKALRMQVGDAEYEKLLEEVVGRGGSEMDMAPELVASFLEESFPQMAHLARSDFARQVKAARDAWLEPFIRDDSGAAVPPHERTQARSTYYPGPFPSKREIAIKRILRAGASEAVRLGMAPRERAAMDAEALEAMGDLNAHPAFTTKRKSRLAELERRRGLRRGK